MPIADVPLLSGVKSEVGNSRPDADFVNPEIPKAANPAAVTFRKLRRFVFSLIVYFLVMVWAVKLQNPSDTIKLMGFIDPKNY